MSGEGWRWLTALLFAAVVVFTPRQCSLTKDNGWHLDIQRDTEAQVEELLAPRR